MSKKKDWPIHLMAKRSFWSGRVVALCGEVAERGEYDTAAFGFFRGKPCTACHRINKKRKE